MTQGKHGYFEMVSKDCESYVIKGKEKPTEASLDIFYGFTSHLGF